MNIGFFQDHNNAMLCYWSVNKVIEAINASGRAKAWAVNRSDSNSYKDCDVVIFYRTSGGSIDFMKTLKNRGKILCYSIDDYLWCDAFRSTGLYHPVEPFMPYCDIIYVPSDMLATKVPAGFSRVIYSEPSLTDEVFTTLSSNQKGGASSLFNILITKGHITQPFLSYIREIVADLKNRKLPGSILFHYFGNFPELLALSDSNIYFVKHDFVGGNPMNFYNYIKNLKVDVFINPLEETEFNDCKCPLKYFESSAMRSALITSRTHPFTSRYIEGENIFFASTPTEYAEKIALLMQDRSLLKKVSEASFELTKEKNIFSVTVNDYIDKMQKAVEELKSNPSEQKVYKTPEVSALTKKQVSKLIVAPIASRNPERVSAPEQTTSNDITLDNVCIPIPFSKHIEQNMETNKRTLKGFWIKGATYHSPLDVPPRVEIFCGHNLVFSGLFDLNALKDNSWWPLFFAEQRLTSRFVKIRIYNNDKKPISFYLARDKNGIAARILDNACDPVAINLV